ncbi:glycoside hydrolase family 18 [Aspergillus oryzae]|uniref:chitinase n=1 Tax=Aspergillus oryzae TaxID=5062 RepID=A0A1S9DP54_ASPOZ|nr:glycoside hydrolase family 18 [Aspergillus oryzae]
MRPSFVLLAFLLGFASAVTESYNGQYADNCPSLCAHAGPSPANWTNNHHVRNLESCDQTVLFGLNIHNSVTDPNTILTIRACVASHGQTYEAAASPDVPQQPSQHNLVVAESCGAKVVKTAFTPQVGPSTLSKASSPAPQSTHVAEATRQLALFVDKSAECGTTILFAKHKSAVVGVYSGAQITKHAVRGFLDSFAEKQTSTVQICQPASAALTVGVASAGFVDLAAAQVAIKDWNNGLCLDETIPATPVSMDVLVSTVDNSFNAPTNTTTISHGNMTARGKPQALLPRGECRTEEVHGGDSCASLASRCGISGNDLSKYNPQKNLCSTLKPKQYVCCNAGTLPDFRPRPQPDGTCNTYKVSDNDNCSDVADAHYLTQQDIEDFNKDTWGWAGCAHLQSGQLICLSEGTPPMPSPVQGATCGPQVPGTEKPSNGTALADLNPCPLNACCDAWGFCGTTVDFCTKSPADTGAPGTAKPGTNGCISNCGMEIVNNGKAPDQLKTIGYFEAFDQTRVCLRMSVKEIPANKYSHIHFAFATVTSSFDVDISDVEYEFSRFVKMSGFKKILTFGGWAFSTEADTFQRFRDATKKEHRETFVNNLVSFMNRKNLDGFDFDWEYPGAPDIPDITPGSPEEGDNYLAFLQLLRSKLPSEKSLSLAVPASYWYLKQYPVKDIAKYVDYFIYMTYDLHGQWDVDNKSSMPGCPAGNCLRSHINKTETHDAMVMITKAGVEARQLVIGITSYARSFRMTDASCSGPFCTFAGDKRHSMAYAGPCTTTGGYISNAELNDIIKNPGNYSIVKSYIDKDSDSNILMYGNPGAVDWAAYMDSDLKTNRINWIKGLNFGGCVHLFALDILYSQLLDSLSLFQANSEGYDDKFGWYEKWTKEQIQPRIDTFMKLGDGKGLKYFDCYWAYTDGKEKKDSCLGMPHIWDVNAGWSIRYDLVDKKGFFDALAAETGIDESWVAFGETSDYTCADPGDPRPGTGGLPCRKLFQKKLNYPQKGSDDKVHVGNPKKLIEASLGNVTALRTSLLSSYLSVGLSFYDDGPNDTSATDAVVAYSMPILQLTEAINSMKDIKEIGEDAKEQAKKDLIFKILTIVFMVIPFVGEALGPLIGSAASVARIALLIGEAGNGALTVADIIEDPSSAPFAVLGLIAGVGGGSGKLSKAEALAEASKARGLLKGSDLAKFPQRFRDQDALVQKVVKSLCARS